MARLVTAVARATETGAVPAIALASLAGAVPGHVAETTAVEAGLSTAVGAAVAMPGHVTRATTPETSTIAAAAVSAAPQVRTFPRQVAHLATSVTPAAAAPAHPTITIPVHVVYRKHITTRMNNVTSLTCEEYECEGEKKVYS